MIPKYDLHKIVANGLKYRRHDAEEALTYLIEACGGMNSLARVINHPMPTVRSWALKGFNAKNPVVEMLLILTECLKTIREGSQAPFTPQKNKPRSKSGKPQDPMKRVIDEDEIEPAMNILNAFLKAYKTKNNVAKTINVKPSTVRGWYEKGGSMSRGSFAFISKFYEENINTKKRRQA